MKPTMSRIRARSTEFLTRLSSHSKHRMVGATVGVSALCLSSIALGGFHSDPSSSSSSSVLAAARYPPRDGTPTNNTTGAEVDAEIDEAYVRHRWRSLQIFSGTANEELAAQIADIMGTRLSSLKIGRYADGEIAIQILENVRGKDVFVVQPTCPPGVNDNLMELILLISTMRRASAHSITAVIPYYGYARQDRKLRSRVPISAADVARLLEAVGVDRVVAVDLHCGQIQGFFGPNTPCDNLDGSVVALPYFASTELALDRNNTVVVSPDAGGVYRAKNFREGLLAMGLNAKLAMIIKQREAANQIKQMDLVGDVEGCDCIIVDDMIDTAGTLCKAAEELKKRGAKRIYAFATHGVFSGPAIDRINQSQFEKVVVCNTIPMDGKGHSDKILVLSVAQLLAKAMESIHFRKSISKLFTLQPGKLPLFTKPVGDHDE
eukprot:CAMPEP_0202695268 /NCGR_PEP_ID=MMETSP1385-20130828/8908_1 /ASSEMBLY_ACC=CAM_ASM_000861 /TAXON_ID=933848 /ORGANISM="Elphidium margaritaceum" /LENGTH=434 /DNA_ID=CAMNT_0049351267 /DNA_START=38 /DNA_END=1342 /DNA_ORIENTATION=+